MQNLLNNFDLDNLTFVSSIVSIIVGILATTLSMLFTTRSNVDSTKNYQEKVKTMAKSLSTQIKLENKEETNETFTKAQSDFFGNINDTINVGVSNDEKIIELSLHEWFMKAHQKQAIIHSRIQFYTGLFMSITGFLLIIYVVVFALSSSSITNILTITSSIVIEGISILFLKESHKLRQSAKEYHDNLSENQKQLQAIKIADSIEDFEMKSAIKAQLALHMIGIHSDNIDTTKILEVMKKE